MMWEKVLIALIGRVSGLDVPITAAIIMIGLILIKGKKSGEKPSEIGVICITVMTVLLIIFRLLLTWWPGPF